MSDIRFLRLAREISTFSKDPSTKVGAIIVRPDRTIASMGFNCFSRYTPDRPEWYADRAEKYSRIIHAEMNALIHAGSSVAGYDLYTYPFMPCDRCTVHMLQAGISRFVFPKPSTDHLQRWGKEFEKSRVFLGESLRPVEMVEISEELAE
jgi:dCMP deaminase